MDAITIYSMYCVYIFIKTFLIICTHLDSKFETRAAASDV